MSLITSVLGELLSARAGTGTPVPYDELPIYQGMATLIADCIADMDLYSVDVPPGRCHDCIAGRHEPITHRVAEVFPVLDQPDPDEDRADTLHKIVQSLFGTGNAWAMHGPRDGAGAVDSVTVVNPEEVGHRVDPLHSLKVKSWTVNGASYDRSALTWWKINDNPRRGPLGRSPSRVCATALDTYGWAYRYLGDYFAAGGNPSSVLKSKLDLSPGKIEEHVNEWIEARKARRPAFLPHHLDLDIPPSSGELAAVIAVLEFATAEFARLNNVPVSLVNAPVAGYTLQYSNVQDEFRRWLAVSLGPTWIRRVERGFSGMLPAGRWAKLDPSSLFPAELAPEPAPAVRPERELVPL